MADLLRRPYQSEDATALADLMNAIEVNAGGHAGYVAAEIATTISELVPQLATDSTLVFGPDGELVAAAIVVSPPAGGFRVDLWGGVHPRWRGQGIGRDLLGAQLDRAAAIHLDVAPGMDWDAHTGAMVDDDEALRLFRRFDLAPVRYWFEMVASTAEPVALAPPDGVRVAQYQTDDEKATYEAHVEAFQDHWGTQRREQAEWVALTVGYEGFLPALSRLAYAGEDLAGYVLCYRDADPSRLYVGQVGTRRPWRRTGVAGGLLSQVITAAKEAGYATVALGVDADSPTGAVGVYARTGFEVDAKAVTYSRSLPAQS